MWQERERVVRELTDVMGQQKTALNGLRCERDSLKAQVASHDPTELRRLREAVASLSERAGELSAMKVVVQVSRFMQVLEMLICTFNGRHCPGHGLSCPQPDPCVCDEFTSSDCLPWAANFASSACQQSIPGLHSMSMSVLDAPDQIVMIASCRWGQQELHSDTVARRHLLTNASCLDKQQQRILLSPLSIPNKFAFPHAYTGGRRS